MGVSYTAREMSGGRWGVWSPTGTLVDLTTPMLDSDPEMAAKEQAAERTLFLGVVAHKLGITPETLLRILEGAESEALAEFFCNGLVEEDERGRN